MRLYTCLWVAWALAGLLIEGSALYGGNYWNTLTGHVEKIALAHPLAAVAVFAVVGGVAFHLLADYLVLRLRP